MKLKPAQIDHMTERFLSWRLPADFAPDGGVVFQPLRQHWPLGTNLLTWSQARAMIKAIAADLPDDGIAPIASGGAQQMETQPGERAKESCAGHGHVRPRPDGHKARCGGPVICGDCAAEAAAVFGPGWFKQFAERQWLQTMK